jgi:hypothetical protein
MTNSGIVSIAVCGSNIHSEIVSVLVGSLGTRLFPITTPFASRFGHRSVIPTGHFEPKICNMPPSARALVRLETLFDEKERHAVLALTAAEKRANMTCIADPWKSSPLIGISRTDS